MKEYASVGQAAAMEIQQIGQFMLELMAGEPWALPVWVV
jgi:hypothetical protein